MHGHLLQEAISTAASIRQCDTHVTDIATFNLKKDLFLTAF